MATILIRTVVLYIALIVTVRIMGKREIAQLQPFEFVTALLLAELTAIPMSDVGIPLLYAFIPMLVLILLHFSMSMLMLKSEKVRAIMCGRPTIVIERGNIRNKELRQLGVSLNDLIEELRIQMVPLDEVEYAIMETNGQLSIIQKSDKRPLTPSDMDKTPKAAMLPLPLIVDCKPNLENLQTLSKDERWLEQELKRLGYDGISDIFFASMDESGKFLVQSIKQGSVLTTHLLEPVKLVNAR